MTNKHTHTPGPWHYEPFVGEPDAIWLGNADGYVAHIRREDGLEPIDWADARLIAEAPAMLEALRLFADELGQWGLDTLDTMNLASPADKLFALLARIEGEA